MQAGSGEGGTCAPPAAGAGTFDLASLLSVAGETAYSWNLQSDAMHWAANAAELLRVPAAGALGTGRAFALLIHADHARQRYEAVTGQQHGEAGGAHPYRVQYLLQPRGRRDPFSLWIEEIGRRRVDAEGRPLAVEGVLRLVNDRYEAEQRLLFLSDHDELTGQMNRARLTERIADLLVDLRQRRGSGGFLMAAVNNLAHINETFGFETGDEVIAIIGRRLRQMLRDADSLGRYGSNKFGVVLADCGSDQVHAVGHRLIDAVRESVVETSAGAIAASVSVGGVLLPQHAETMQQVVSRGLEALEWARARRTPSFALYVPSQRRDSRRRRNIAIADQVQRALNEGRMHMALQPIMKAGTRELAFHECLLRMREADGTTVAAHDFIPVAEQLGLASLVDHCAVRLVVDCLRESPDLNLALNVSGETATNPEWPQFLRDLTLNDRSITERLTVEITETSAISDIEESVKFVEGLRRLGCRIAIDDFGAGYWSFRALRFLNPDMVKIDGSFVRNLVQCSDDWLFIRALLQLAHGFGMETVAEWVEDEATARLIEQAGFTYLQGHFFGFPEPAQALDEAPAAFGLAAAQAGAA